MKPRGTVTNKLADVIQVLQTAHKSGLMTVQRDGLNNALEQGVIIFQNGQVIDASLGLLRGGNAFKVLSSWTTCHFVFQPPPSQHTSPFPATPFPVTPPTPTPYSNGRTIENGSQGSADQYAPVVPYRIGSSANGVLPDFQNLGLSRVHRQLFLLIDGRRPVQELMRLMGQRSYDVLSMLSDLENASLIRK